MVNAHPLTKVLASLEWSQSELARRAKVSQSTISFVLGGKRGGKFSPETASKILRAVGQERARLERCAEAGGKVRMPRAVTLVDLVFVPGMRIRA